MIRIALTALVCTALVFAQGKSKGKSQAKPEPAGAASGMSGGVAVVFGNDAAVIRNHVRSLGAGGLPPGLAKRGGALPPGLEKQLQRNGRLPPGLEKQMSPFPPDLERRLSPLPSGYVRVFVAGRAVILNQSTQVIADMFVALP